MKLTYLFALSILLAALGTSQAQVCIPNQSITQTGFYPAVLDTAEINVDYKQELQIRVLKDTTIIIFGSPQKAYIDSIFLTKIIGLPDGFTYACYNAACRYVPDTTGCAVLYGKPKAADAGVYPLKLAVNIFGHLSGGFKAVQPDTIRNFTLVVGKNTASIVDLNSTPIGVYPNPALGGIIHLQTRTALLPATFIWYTADGKLSGSQEITEQNTVIDLQSKPSQFVFGILKSAAGRDLWKGRIAVMQP